MEVYDIVKMETYSRKSSLIKNKKSIIKTLVAGFEKLSTANSFLFRLYSAPYCFVLDREIKLAKINSRDIVLNIGCGGMPFTAIYIAQKTGAKVIAIDNDPMAVEMAKNNVIKSRLSDKITVECVDGKDYNKPVFNKAIIALQASPKNEILHSLIRIAPKGSKLLFRQARNAFKNQYDILKADNVSGVVTHKMLTFNQTLLFQK